MQVCSLSDFIRANLNIDEAAIESIIALCRRASVKKNDFLLRQGERCRHYFFVEKGLLRQYGIDDKGKEHVIQFAPQGWFVSDRESMFFNHPSQYFIQALENSDILLLDENFQETLTAQNPYYTQFNNRLLHNHIRHLQKRIFQLQSATAETRYLDFVHTYPDVLLRVPQAMVASYLGITPESLSRVRKDLAQRNG